MRMPGKAEFNDAARGLAKAFEKQRASKGKTIGFFADPTGQVTAHPAESDKIFRAG